MRRYDEGLSGYTYLEDEPATAITNGGSGLTVLPRPEPAESAPRLPESAEREPVPPRTSSR